MSNVGGLVQGRVAALVDGVNVGTMFQKQLHHPCMAEIGGQVKRRLVEELLTAACGQSGPPQVTAGRAISAGVILGQWSGG